MEQFKIDRINELARISLKRELTKLEQAERQSLRAEYLSEWRQGAISVLESVRVVDENGEKHRLKKK